jgi:hypothetical protein
MNLDRDYGAHILRLRTKRSQYPCYAFLIFRQAVCKFTVMKIPIRPNYKVYAYVVKHKYILVGMLFTVCKAQLHVSATNSF